MAGRLTPSCEDYLEAIYDLSRGGGQVRSVDVAARLGVSRASVSKAAGLLREAELIDQQPYGAITLTPRGLALASRVRRCHSTLKSFLLDVLGVDPQTAEDEACRMEHAISEDTLDRLADFLENLKKQDKA